MEGKKEVVKTSFVLRVNPATSDSEEEEEPEEELLPEREVQAGESDVIFIEEWSGTVIQSQRKFEKHHPVPYIVSFSPTGLMHIGWSDRMKPPEKIEEIPPSLFAVEIDD